MKDIIKLCIRMVLFILFIFGASYLLKGDFRFFMMWWFALFALGIIFLPISNLMFEHFQDKGYMFSKTIGLAISGYLMWLLSSLKILKFTSISCIVVVFLCVLGNIFIYRYGNKKGKHIITKDKLNIIVTEEILFFLIFLAWVYIRGFKPEAYGTEKYMDYGFMTAMMRSEYMPPKDLWFAGNTINYYYVGQYLATFMTKLSHVSVNVGYNLMLMTISALGFMLPFSLIYNLTINYYKTRLKTYKIMPTIAGLLAGSGVSLAGNLHFTVFYYFVPILQDILGLEGKDKYWFPDSTRYIGYHPETSDKTIHEFPNYSFVLGDLHAHVINLIFVLTVVGILYGFVLKKKQVLGSILPSLDEKVDYIKELFNPHILLISFFIGLFHTTNFWDFPIYYVVAGAIILFMNIKQFDTILNVLKVTALQGVFVIAVAKIVALPFSLKFDQIATEIRISENHTPIYQLIILWGLPVLLVIGLLIHLITDYKEGVSYVSLAKINGHEKNDQGKKRNPLILFIKKLTLEDLFILTIGLCAIGLVLIPELIYVKDIYSGDYKRANTMFKLTYQAFTLFAIAMSFIFIKFLCFKQYNWNKTLGYFGLILFALTLPYAKVSISAWYGNILDTSNYKGIDAAKFMETTMEDDNLAITWMNENIKGTPVILEANGDSYSDYGRISVITGLPTVLGWYVHEWLWRGDTSLVDERVNDIQTIYTSTDINEVKTLIDKYDIEYIYVGKLEYDKFTSLNDELIKSLGEIVFLSPKDSVKYYESYLVKIQN